MNYIFRRRCCLHTRISEGTDPEDISSHWFSEITVCSKQEQTLYSSVRLNANAIISNLHPGPLWGDVTSTEWDNKVPWEPFCRFTQKIEFAEHLFHTTHSVKYLSCIIYWIFMRNHKVEIIIIPYLHIKELKCRWELNYLPRISHLTQGLE